MTAAVLAFLLLLLVPWPAAAQRLPGGTVPRHYTLWFAPDLERETFRGRATIDVRVERPTRAVVLHAIELDLAEVTIAAGGRVQRASVTFDPKAETATLTVPQTVPAGDAVIDITYTGILNDKLRGFYVSRANGRKYAVTQMEATDARRAFPSFDEPALKATFDLSLTIAASDTAISNGAQISDVAGPDPGTHTVTFARTPKMSTYLVAMLVGDFACRSGASDGTAIRICATPDKLELTAFALESAEQQLAFYNRYFGVPYAFGKLDIIAVPDFAAGAMENAGAITFRERLLLIDADRASIGARKRVASVISHEIAHQWFGNLVTMRWWDDIWLNEGFATWLENKPLAAAHPEWRVDLDDASATQGALATDALATTRAIRIRVETADEINEVFDGIAYEKAAAVLRMLEAYVGPELFARGISSYLRKFAYANAAGEDFWNEMARVTRRPIDRIMKGFVEQAGAPVVGVESQCTNGRSRLSLTQQRFTTGAAGPAPAAPLWTLPVCVAVDGGAATCHALERRRQTFDATGCGPLVANAGSRGYYFSEYTPDAVRALAARAATVLDPVERLGLLGDEWWMARGGRHGIDVYLDLAGSLADDTTPAVIDAVSSRLAFTGEQLVGPAQRPLYREWLRARFGPILSRLGLPGSPRDTDDIQGRRAELLTLLGSTADDASVQQAARELAARYIDDPSSLAGTLAPSVLRVAALAGDRSLYEAYLEQAHRHRADPEEYHRFFDALAWFRDPMLTERTLAYALSNEVRTQDTGGLLAGLLARPWSRDAAWSFVKAQWPTLTARLGTFQGIPAIVGATGNFCSPAAAEEVREFFRANPVPSAQRTLRQALERIESCAALRARQESALSAWLSAAR